MAVIISISLLLVSVVLVIVVPAWVRAGKDLERLLRDDDEA